MAEFVEVMKQARRMCGSNFCDNCILPRCSDEMCIWENIPARITDEVIAEIEAKILQWAAEHPNPPEPKYPTWREWQQEHFRDNATMIRPCVFMSKADAHCIVYMGSYDCCNCVNQPIPADIAEKLGIKPKEADHEKC